MRLFITGASGYVGSVLTEKAVKAGHEVIGLARSQASADKIEKLGGKALRGTLQDLDLLSKTAATADAVLHLGFVHEFDRPYPELLAIDIASIEALATPLKGTNKVLITTSGTSVVTPIEGQETTEDSPVAPQHEQLRVRSEKATLEFAKHGVRAIVIRLAAFVYGRGGSYFVPITIQAAAKHGFVPYFGDGQHMLTAADVDDAAELYLKALEHGKAGELFNCSTETTVRFKDFAETIGRALSIPTKSVDAKTLDSLVGPFVGMMSSSESRASSAKAHKELGWKPSPRYGLLDDIEKGSYQPMVQQLRKEFATVK